MITVDFAESQEKKRVKKDGSFSSMIMKIVVSLDCFSSRKSFSRNFCMIFATIKIHGSYIIQHILITDV